jgi:hypothetical protein
VRIQGRNAIAVRHHDHIAVASADAAAGHAASARGLDRRAGGCREIDAAMRAHAIQDRMPARQAVTRADAPVVDRITQEGLAHRPAVGRVVIGVAFRRHIAHGTIGAA